MYFYTFFHLHVFSKNINNVTKVTLPNGSEFHLELEFLEKIFYINKEKC